MRKSIIQNLQRRLSTYNQGVQGRVEEVTWGEPTAHWCAAPSSTRQSSPITSATVAFASAFREGHPFEVVVIGTSAGQRDPAPAIDEMLALDPLITIVLAGPTGGSPSERLLRLPRLEPATGRELAAALAQSYRTRRELADTRRELEHSHRAGRVVSSEFKRQNLRLEEQEKQQRLQNQRFDAALNNMSQGLCMFDADGRLVVSNRRYIEMYRLPAEIVRPGCRVEKLV